MPPVTSGLEVQPSAEKLVFPEKRACPDQLVSIEKPKPVILSLPEIAVLPGSPLMLSVPSLDALTPLSVSSRSSSSVSPGADSLIENGQWTFPDIVRKLSDPKSMTEMLAMSSSQLLIPGLFSSTTLSPQGFISVENPTKQEVHTPAPAEETEYKYLITCPSLVEDCKPFQHYEDTKPPRLTVNGKRVGRPPGTTKPVVVTRIDPKTMETSNCLLCMWDGCREEFFNKAEFYEHVKDHHTPSGRQCLWEGCTHGRFPAYYQLLTHMRTHTKEKPYLCGMPGCTKEYSRLENLKTHRRTHTGEKPYICELIDCSKAFTNASDRAKHQNRTHSDAKPYDCKVPLCGKAYTDPSSLRKHFKSIHADLLESYLPISRKYGNVNIRKRSADVKEEQEIKKATPIPNNFPTSTFPPQLNMQSFGMPAFQLPQLPMFNPMSNPMLFPFQNPYALLFRDPLLSNTLPGLPTHLPCYPTNQFSPMFNPVYSPMFSPMGSMNFPCGQLPMMPQSSHLLQQPLIPALMPVKSSTIRKDDDSVYLGSTCLTKN